MNSMIFILPLFLFAQNNYVFGPSIIVNDDPPGTHFHATTQRSIACRGDTVYLVWRDDRYETGLDRNARIFFSKSGDAGNIWSPNLMISHNWDSLGFFLPHMTLDGNGNIYVAYCSASDNNNDRDIYFTKSTDGGVSFTPPIMVNDSTVVQWQTFCACAVNSSGQNVYVVWEDRRNLQYRDDIYLARSTDGGLSFLPSVRVNDDTVSVYQWFPVVVCDESGQNVYVAWEDFRDTLYGANVYFARSTDYGQTFGPNYCVNDTISTGSTNQRVPSIYCRNNVILLAWRDERDSYCLYFTKSTDGGLSFGNNVRVPDNPNAYGYNPSITANDSGVIFVVWEDNREYSSYGTDIYFSFSRDSGQTFKPNVRVNDHLGNLSAWDFVPSVCANQMGRVFVTWSSDRNDPAHSDFDIYFAGGSYIGIHECANSKLSSCDVHCYPNPFREQATISCVIRGKREIDRAITVKVYDAAGRLVKCFTSGIRDELVILWDGTNDYSRSVPAGVYFVEVINDKDKCVEKVIKTGGLQ